MDRAGTSALMVFHQPFLNAVATAFPDADVLLGKPMPVAAAETFYRGPRLPAFDPATQVQWLIDTMSACCSTGRWRAVSAYTSRSTWASTAADYRNRTRSRRS